MNYLITNITNTFITVNNTVLAPSKSTTVTDITPEITVLNNVKSIEIIPVA
jgi:hypothetical protein